MLHPQFSFTDELHVIGLASRITRQEGRTELSSPTITPTHQARLPNRGVPHLYLRVLTDYDSSDRETYTQIVGGLVRRLKAIPVGMVGLTIPPSRYLIFSSQSLMPNGINEMWQTIEQSFKDRPQVKRAYTIDFEIHDLKAPNSVDIYIAIL